MDNHKSLHPDDVKETAPVRTAEEAMTVAKLMELTEGTSNPWRDDFDTVIRDCYNFKELKQWDSEDVQLVLSTDTPALPIDRINRSLDTIRGIRSNTDNRKKIVSFEMHDAAIADVLDKVCNYFDSHSDFDDSADDAFDNMLTVGIGLQKVGWDSKARGGEGELWSESCDIESVQWSKTRDKKFKDIRWIWQHYVMGWEEAMKRNPLKAPELASLKATIAADWETKKGAGVSQSLTKDYQGNLLYQEGLYSWKDMMHLFEFYVLRTVPLKKIMYTANIPIPPEVLQQQGMQLQPGQEPPTMQVPQTKFEPSDYQPQEGEEAMDIYHDEWWQYIVAAGTDKNSGIILTEQYYGDEHPYAPYVAQFKKSGQPFGFVEQVIPHQKRINISWSQKTGWNNKSLKTPLILHDGDLKDNNIDHALQQSAIGSVLILSKNAQTPIINQQPPTNIQAIEEGNVAREDMDFTAAASEPVLRGQAGTSKSGIQMSMQQSAAVTPLNKWVQAERSAQLVFWRKALKLIVRFCPPDRIRRIVGEQFFDSLTQPQIDPASGQPMPPKIQLPFNIDMTDYDVKIEDSSVSDFNKQQSFNAIEALVQGGVAMDDDFRIRNAPLKDTDGALLSNQKARNDMIRQMQFQIQILQAQLGEAQKQAKQGNRNKFQPRNRQQGQSASQSGKRSMTGGQTA